MPWEYHSCSGYFTAPLTEADTNVLTCTLQRSILSIDLNSTSTNQTMDMTTIHKDAPVFNSEELWVDASSRSFNAYGGLVSGTVSKTSPPANSLWQFKPSGASGNWSVDLLAQQADNFTFLARTWNGAYGCFFSDDSGLTQFNISASQSFDGLTGDSNTPP